MKRLIAIAAMLLASCAAHAQAPPCVAGLYGPVGATPPQMVYGKFAIHYVYTCRNEDNTVTPRVQFLEKYSLSAVTAFAAAMAQAIQDSINAPDGTTLKVIWSPLFSRPECTVAERTENSDRGRICGEAHAIAEAYLAEHSAPGTIFHWKVKANGAYPDRPVQRISATNGLTTIPKVRVLVGAPCYPSVRQFTNAAGNTYVAIDPAQPDRVAVCVKG